MKLDVLDVELKMVFWVVTQRLIAFLGQGVFDPTTVPWEQTSDQSDGLCCHQAWDPAVARDDMDIQVNGLVASQGLGWRQWIAFCWH